MLLEVIHKKSPIVDVTTTFRSIHLAWELHEYGTAYLQTAHIDLSVRTPCGGRQLPWDFCMDSRASQPLWFVIKKVIQIFKNRKPIARRHIAAIEQSAYRQQTYDFRWTCCQKQIVRRLWNRVAFVRPSHSYRMVAARCPYSTREIARISRSHLASAPQRSHPCAGTMFIASCILNFSIKV